MRVVFAALAVLLLAGASGAATRKQGGDWTRFGYDAQRSSSGPAATGITAANVRRLVRRRVVLDGTVDSSPIYLRGVTVAGQAHDTFFVTTTYGKTEAIDATSGRVLWRFTPPGYSSWAGSARITNATPLADPSRKFVYAVSPDGRIHKLSVANGREASGWPVTITLDPTHEKIAPPLNYSRGLVLAATGGYYRRRAAVPGARRLDRRRDRPHPPRLELALLQPLRADHALELHRERLGDLGPRGCRGRAGHGQPARGDRQREVRRPARTGATAR